MEINEKLENGVGGVGIRADDIIIEGKRTLEITLSGKFADAFDDVQDIAIIREKPDNVDTINIFEKEFAEVGALD